MKSNQIKRVFIVVSVFVTLAIFGLITPVEECCAEPIGQEQITDAHSEQGQQPSSEHIEPSLHSFTVEPHSVKEHSLIQTHESLGYKIERLTQELFSWSMWRLLLGGLETTLLIFIFASIHAILLGALLAYMAITHKWTWIYKPLNWFVTTVHDIPSVALMMFFYYVIFAGELNGIVVSIIALGVYTSGSLAKIFKIHIMQVGKGQIEAGRALGMTSRQCYRYIVIPQAVKSMLPLFIADLNIQLRATSYAGYIAQEDMIKAVFTVREQTADTFLPLIIVSILYLIIAWMIGRVTHIIYAKLFKYD